MTGEELAGYYNGLNAQKSDYLQELVDGKASKEEITSLKEELKTVRNAQFKTLEDRLKNAELTVKKLTEQEQAEASDKIDTIQKGLESNREALTLIKGNSSEKLYFKVAGTMLSSTNISGGNVPVEQRIAGLDVIPSRTVRLLDIVSKGAAESPVISWVSQANKDGAAGQTGEGDLKNQIDFDLVVNQESLKKTTAYIKISDEMLGDVPFMQAEINNELMREILKKVEEQVYEGDNTGNNLNGILTQASAFVASTAPEAVDNANLVDVLRTATTQIKIANQDAPTYHLLHPTDVLGLLQIKRSTTDKAYIDALQMVAGSLRLDGVPIIETTLVTAGTYLTGDFRKSTVYDKGSIDMKVGYENDDFTKNLVTILAEWRGLNVIKTNQTDAFVTGVIATDKAALEAL
jgi:HK97 family phage major capsid protein